jgi:hypothetical protein
LSPVTVILTGCSTPYGQHRAAYGALRSLLDAKKSVGIVTGSTGGQGQGGGEREIVRAALQTGCLIVPCCSFGDCQAFTTSASTSATASSLSSAVGALLHTIGAGTVTVFGGRMGLPVPFRWVPCLLYQPFPSLLLTSPFLVAVRTLHSFALPL